MQNGQPPPIEGRIAAVSDRIAYALHDVHDGLYAGLIDIASLKTVPVFRRFLDSVTLRDVDSDAWRSILRPTTDRLQEHLLQAVSASTRARSGAGGHDRRHSRRGQVALPDDVEAELAALEKFLFERLYRHARIQRADRRAKRVIHDVFAAYMESPGRLPERFQSRIESQGVQRVAADYIAGMTDRFILREWRQLRGSA